MENLLKIRTGQEPVLTISDTAAKFAKKIMKDSNNEEKLLRIRVMPSHSGFSYDLFFDDQKEKDDVLIQKSGLKIVLDDISAELMKGSTLEYEKSESGEGFKINNPNASMSGFGGGCGSGCGCS